MEIKSLRNFCNHSGMIKIVTAPCDKQEDNGETDKIGKHEMVRRV